MGENASLMQATADWGEVFTDAVVRVNSQSLLLWGQGKANQGI
jgi:hypothetical protein